jgi:hypothetical protein
MKRIDRATYLVFLLVLLADVARASASVPIGIDTSDQTILQQVLREAHRGGQNLGTPETATVENSGNAQSGAVSEARNGGFDFLANYRSAARRYRSFDSGPVRGLFSHIDQTWLAAARFEPLADADLGITSVRLVQIQAPAISVVEHLGSPAP